VQIALSETLIWRMADLLERLQRHREGIRQSGQQLAAVDAPLRIRLLSTSGLRTSISFQSDPLSRPRRAPAWRRRRRRRLAHDPATVALH
jgi:hypothetical protein